MRVLVTGATGYIGGRLVPRLRKCGYEVRCFARAAQRLCGRFDEGVEIVEGDVNDEGSLLRALRGCDAAYYLVHSMGSTNAFANADREAARTFGAAARAAGVATIVYLGGLGNDRDALSTHLRSRHEVGDVLRSSRVRTIEFRAALIIGSGSISFEMMRYLTERLPVMIAPKWVVTRCQPIGVNDVLAYLTAALELNTNESAIYEIGGADVLSYRDMMLRYAEIRDLKRRIVIVPFFTPQLSSYWVHLVTPISARLAQPLIRGLYNEVVVRDFSATRDFPKIVPNGFDDAVRSALERGAGAETTWFDAFDLHALPADFAGVREGMLIDMRVRTAAASPERVAAVFSSLGGRRGWLSADALWRFRGWIDRVAGGVGLRRGRRSPTELRPGDALDFWRVEAYEPGRLLRLRAEMKLPGRAWLQFEAEPSANGAATLRQTAVFEPRGLMGFLYWYGVALFHAWVFGSMATRIVREAEKI
ncbi:MAG TPA: SDR family oxidoreductase [Candidatus Baltobacteraceae bacterium]|jgi:uncharacterized protein YbjT (DUF2867 family)|nr:SDR family oxidoreductase [Candidatus Baltobacteraceae bacterium]